MTSLIEHSISITRPRKRKKKVFGLRKSKKRKQFLNLFENQKNYLETNKCRINLEHEV